ncbi:MAG TPA: iron-sulfur cluster assembly accessory protein, partial [Usitatibacter sp.]|nr:iron-sulfur cluster assembly accessory protein [Usitatibacter sp.]
MAVTLTDRAAEHVQRFIQKRGKGVGLRLGVRTTGCSGLAYKLEFADEIQPGDQEFESNGIRVLIDP